MFVVLSKQCFCGEATDDPTGLGPATCDFECAGDHSDTCGGYNAITVYKHPEVVVVDPTPTPLGCWKDSKHGRIMTHKETSGVMTTDVR